MYIKVNTYLILYSIVFHYIHHIVRYGCIVLYCTT